MKVIKTLFPDKPLERRLDKFSPKTTPLKLRGNENEKMKFLGFPKSGMKFSKYIFISNFFFFLENIFGEKNLSRFWKIS